jgi:hypothetical protein
MLTTITEIAQERIMASLYRSAQDIAAESDGFFVAIKPDLNRFGYQSISASREHYVIEGSRLPVDDLDGLAGLIDGRFPAIAAAISRTDDESAILTGPRRTLDGGRSVFLAGPHSEFIDIARDTVAVSNQFRRQKVAHRTGLIASKAAIDYLGVNLESFNFPPEVVKLYMESIGVPIEPDNTATVHNFIKVAFNRTYLTIPATQSQEDLRRRERTAVQWHNHLVTNAIHSDIEEFEEDFDKKSADKKDTEDWGAMLLAAAFTGSMIKNLDRVAYEGGKDIKGFYEVFPPELPDGNEPIEVLPHISSRTSDVTRGSAVYAFAVLPDVDNPKVAIDRDVHYVRKPEHVQDLAISLMGLLRQLDPSIRMVYDSKGNAPLFRKGILNEPVIDD